MTTAQIITITLIGIAFIIAFIFGEFSENEQTKTNCSILMFMLMAMMTVIAIISTSLANHYGKLNGKCPEYEPVENVYKLKKAQ